jgi:hypothetical protein
MQSAAAEVIDLQAYRAVRAARRQAGTGMPAYLPLPVALVPVWFVPVYLVGAQTVSAAH